MPPPLETKQEEVLNDFWYTQNMKVGIRKLYELIKEENHQNISYRQVGEWLKHQEDYQINQHKRNVNHLRIITATKPFQLIQIDLLDFSQGQPQKALKYILNIIDVHTRYLISVPLYNKEGKNLADHLREVFNNIEEIYGFNVRRLMSDKGGEFSNPYMTRLINEKDITHTTSNFAQVQGIVERVNRTLRQFLGRLGYANDHSTWFNLNKAVHLYNNTYHRTIKNSPSKLLNDCINDDQNIKDRNNQQKEYTQRNILKHANSIINASQNLQEGDFVRKLRRKKGMLDKTKDFLNWSDQIFRVERKKITRRPDLKPRYVIRNANNNHLLQKSFFREELLKIPDMMPENMPTKIEDEDRDVYTKPDKKSDKDKERLRRERISKAIDEETEILPERKRILPKRFRD